MTYTSEMRFEDGVTGLRENDFYGGEDDYLEASYEDRATGGADYVPEDYDSPAFMEDELSDGYEDDDDSEDED